MDLLFTLTYIFFSLIGCFFIIAGTVGFCRHSDFYIKCQATLFTNIYGISFLLVGFAILNGNIITFLKLLTIIVINIILTLSIVHTMGRLAFTYGVPSNGKNRRDIEAEENQDEGQSNEVAVMNEDTNVEYEEEEEYNNDEDEDE